jgi:hypothetical protein
MSELNDLNPDDRREILDAVGAALKALIDLRLELKLTAVDLINEWVELELASWERAQDPTTH